MAINLGDIARKNKNQKKVGSLNLSQNKIKQEEEKKNTWFNSGAFSDGYQFGDLTKTALGTAGDIAVNLGKGVVSAGESIGDLAAYAGAQVVDWLGNEKYADEVRKAAAESLTDKIFSPVDETVDKYSVLGEKSDSIANSIGNMYAQFATSSKLLGDKGNIPINLGGKKFNLPVSSLVIGASSGMSNAVNKGAEDWQIWTSGVTSGLAEAVSESLFGTFGIGGSDLDDYLVKAATDKMKSSLAKSLTRAGIKAVGEGAEEVVSYLLNYAGNHAIDYVKNTTGLSGVDIAEEFNKEEMWDNFFAGAIAAGLGGIPSTISEARGNTLGYNVNEGINQFRQNQNVNLPNPNRYSLPTYNQNIENTIVNDAVNSRVNQNMLQNNISAPVMNSEGNVVNPNRYVYIKSDNANIDNLRRSASQYFNNSSETRNFLNTIEKIIGDKDYSVVFDDSIVNSKGNSVNAQISTENGKVTIKINPNSDRAGEFLLAHEITHAIETDTLKQFVIDFASNNPEFNTALENLKRTYRTNDVNSELLADISGQLLGNQEFINSLTIQNTQESKSIIRQIYESIRRLLNSLTENGRYRNFVQDLETMWREAYRTTTTEQAINNINNNTFYSINQNFASEYDNWNKRNINGYFIIGKTSNALKSIGLDERNIVIDKSKIMAIKNKHPEMTDNIIKQIPNILENPTIILKSQSVSGRLVVFGDVVAADGKPVLVAMELNPAENNANVDKIYKVASAYGRQNVKYIQNWLNNPNNILYIDSQKNRTINWLNGLGLQLPVPLTNNGSSANNIPQSTQNVNSSTSTTYSMQENQNNSSWQEYLEENYPARGTRTNMQNIRIPTSQDIQRAENSNINLPKPSKVLNPLEISQLTPEDANTTPILPNVNRNRVNDGESSFASNIRNKTNMLNEQQKNTILANEEVNYYDTITNEESLNEAFSRLNENGEVETLNWFSKDSEKATAVDVAEGWILLKQYADNNNSDGMVAVAKKLRDMGTKAGQTVQAFNIMARMTPEGMVKYAQSELMEAYDRMVKNKTKKWIDQHQKDFDLTPQETAAIMDIMQKVSTMPDGYDKRVELAKIQKIMTDKLPPERGAGIKSWMRISMLFNPKTQIRNIAGNAIIAPFNSFSDLFASIADKVIGSKTGYRTTGVTNIQNYVKGFKEGLYQSYNDLKLGINTRNIQGNRFEIGQGRSFNNNTAIGKALNRVDSLLSFMLDAGDRTFYEATFTNSINNQLVLNNTTEITQDMIDIATQEALSRTWQDNNNYTKFVLNVRKMLNNVNFKGYGLGDVLIPFAKTPANLTKAIVDYSPVGLVNALVKGKRLSNAIENGQFTPQMQHDFVQSLGKAVVGTMLYVAGYALAKAGIVSGESDDDKDVQNFMRNTLGVNSYSIKIGDMSFTYDWAQPIAAPLSIMANIVQKEDEDASTLETILSSLDTAGNILLEQSFMESINTALNNNDGLASGIQEAIFDLPARAVPTFMKQIADMIDGTQRTNFEYGKPLESAINSVKAKIPFLSKTLAPSVDSMGREIQKYGGNNNIFNVFFNPANVSTENISESAGEIYRLYQETGDTTIMPRVAPYYINKDGEKITMDSSQRAEYQKISGNIIEENVGNLLDNSDYEKLSDEDKSSIIKSIVDYSYNKAREEVLGLEMSSTYNKVNKYTEQGGNVSDYYLHKEEINYALDNPEKYTTILQITDYDNYLTYKDRIDEIRDSSDNKKMATINYINSLRLSIPQKAMFIRLYYSSFDDYNEQIINYVNQNVSSMDEKILILTELGFTIKDGRVYW